MKETVKNGILLLLMIFAILTLYIINSELLSFFMVCTLLGFALVDVITWMISSPFLSVNVVTKESVDKRGDTTVVLEMQNKSIFLVWCMRVEVDITNVLTKNTRRIKRSYILMPLEKEQSVIFLQSNHRGRVVVKLISATHVDGLHILSRKVKNTSSATVIVYPKRVKHNMKSIRWKM